ncbi:MAG: hypothetical protein IJS70_06895 [Bacteroidales bacterium]|nr:hypothetical protein [Bacteroidales bacterium]MBQ7458881.1 hypothetical protein [Bacteroidales bacterium]MBQ9529515.1 hypothetical protein [Bacteroidales bacterium]
MKKLFAIIAFCILTATAVNAQDYSKAIGIEGGWEGVGLTFKQFTSGGNFMDYKANVYINGGLGAIASATYDFNVPLAPGFSFFYGLGLEAGFFTGHYHGYDYTGNLMAGAFGNVGIEYAFSAIPFAISLDWNPGIRLIIKEDPYFGPVWTAGCLGIKYTF